MSVHGDSMIIINWMNKKMSCYNLSLQAFLEETRQISEEFEDIIYYHICRELNMNVHSLSKEGLLMKKVNGLLRKMT